MFMTQRASSACYELAIMLIQSVWIFCKGSDFDDWHLQEHDLENIEQVSLDSYSSNEQSDDGYPQMGLDLDTIDSGFLESDCSSPSAFDENEQIETSSLEGVGCSHSNYVKQWVAFTSVQVDAHSNGK